MAAQLGIGTRVWIGWVPDCNINVRGVADPRTKTGTIIEGPIPKGTRCTTAAGRRIVTKETMWNVAVDGDGIISADEAILIPIEGGEPEASERTRRRPRTEQA